MGLEINFYDLADFHLEMVRNKADELLASNRCYDPRSLKDLIDNAIEAKVAICMGNLQDHAHLYDEPKNEKKEKRQ